MSMFSIQQTSTGSFLFTHREVSFQITKENLDYLEDAIALVGKCLAFAKIEIQDVKFHTTLGSGFDKRLQEYGINWMLELEIRLEKGKFVKAIKLVDDYEHGSMSLLLEESLEEDVHEKLFEEIKFLL